MPEGKRNVTATEIAGHFIGKGVSPAVTETVLLNCFAPGCTPPMSAKAVHTVVQSIDRAERSKREHSFVEIGESLETLAEQRDRHRRVPC